MTPAALQRLTVFSTDPKTGGKVVCDLAEGTPEAIARIVALHNYQPGVVDTIFGTPILEVRVESVQVQSPWRLNGTEPPAIIRRAL